MKMLRLWLLLICLLFAGMANGATFLRSIFHTDYSENGTVESDSPAALGVDLDEVPVGAASLAFVFDITGSMYDDLVQVIDGAAKILATTLARRDKPLYNYVLVPFHDPEVGPVTVTTDPDKYQRDLRELYVQGGGDCPEMSITAIKLALEHSLPYSFVYVFTDARAKDYSLTEQVLTLIQQKQSQVVFVMTGDCGDTSHPGYKAYEQIASTSSGQIFLLKKSQVNQVLNFVRVAVQSRKVNLVSMDRNYLDSTLVYELPVDSHLQEFTISVSGERPQVTITDPLGRTVTNENGLKSLLRLRNALILNVKDPSPGRWTLRVSADGAHTIRVTGLSSLDFVHGFSLKPTLILTETDARPIKGIPMYLLLNATDLDLPGRIYRLELVNLHGDILAEIPIQHHDSRPSIYNISNFIAPAEFFFLKAVGVDNKGYEFQRTSPTAISSINPAAPHVLTHKITRGYYDETAVLTCVVNSLIPFSVQWYHNGRELGNRLFYSESANVTWSVPSASSQNEGYYSCNATSAAGTTIATTLLDVKDPPPSILKPDDVSAVPGTDAMFTCVTYSSVDFNITWLRLANSSTEYLPLGSRSQVFTNGSMVIRNVEKSDEGLYVCRAANEGGFNEGIARLIIQREPKVSVSPSRQTFIVGSSVQIACSAVAYPKPVFEWRRTMTTATSAVEVEDLSYDESGDVDNTALSEEQPTANGDRITWDRDTGLLSISETLKQDAGTWECVATNALGTGSASASLDYIELPTIVVPERIVLVNNGDPATLRCEASGIPKPNVTWYRDGIELHELSFIQISSDGTLTILGTQDVDAGEYECVATNDAGSSSEIVELDVGSSPVVMKSPQNRGVDILKNISLPCSAVGKPEPAITWSRADGKAINFDNNRIAVLSDGTLVIRGILKEEEGMYVCHIENQFGKHRLSAFITVTGVVKPLIAYASPNVAIIEGRDVKLSCMTLLGNPTPRITWYRSGEMVSLLDDAGRRRTIDDGNGNLLLQNVRIEDEGEYTCVASNAGGNDTQVIRLDVHVPPTIPDSPNDVIVTQGRSVRLPCDAQGDPKPQVTWTKNGVRLSEVDPHYFISESGSLEIFSADPQDTATYSCTAINVAGVREKRIMLFVQIPPIISEDHGEVTVIVNNPIQLSCEVTGIPPPEIRWKKGDENTMVFVSNSERSQILPNGALRINHVTLDDAGMYMCLASSSAGNASKTVMLNVQVPPTLIQRAPSSIITLAGSNVTLPCEVSGDPRPRIEWSKDQSKIDVDSEMSQFHKYLMTGTGSLIIPLVDVNDAARYQCVAENPAGVVTQEINLIVHEPPSIVPGTQTSTTIIENNRVVLPCPARGTPPPKIRWFKNGVALSGNEIGERVLPDGSLQVEHASSNHTGRYRCVAENVAGNVTFNIELTVFVSPRFPGSGSTNSDGEMIPELIQVKQSETILLQCPARAVPPPQITWYRDGDEITEDIIYDDSRISISEDGTEMVIEGAEVDDAARYTCIARNLAGELEKNFDVDVHVPPKLDESLVSKLNISVIVDNPVVIDCSADGIPPPEIIWYKDGREVTADQLRDIRVRILPSGRRLEITSADLADAGAYKCVAKNAAGKVERQFELFVWIPAKIESSEIISTPEVLLNQTITIFCPASGVPDPDLTWFVNNVPFTSNTTDIRIIDNGFRLHIDRAQVSHASRYTCQAKNIAGQATKHYDLSVLVIPVIDRTNIVLDPTVVINQTLAINCHVSGIPTPEIVWLRNGELLDTVIHPNVKVLGEGRQLRIERASVTDTAIYRCLASNKAGRDSVDFQVSVHIPTSIDRTRVDGRPTVIANQARILDCPVLGIPPPVVTWYKNGQRLVVADQKNLRLRHEGRKLEFVSAGVADAGIYECRASNEAGSDSISFDLRVYVPPQINLTTTTQSNPRVVIGSTVTIKCNVHGIPPPAIQWLVNNHPLDTFNRRYKLLDDGHQLEITNTEVSDTGRYTCIAKNEAGIVDRDFDLEVLVPPHIDSTNLEMKPSVIRGKAITLNCPVHGVPFPNITWLKQGRVVQESSRIRFLLSGRQLELSLAEEGDAAQYTCEAVNIAGKATKDFNLDVYVPPAIDEANIVDNPKIVVNRTVLLECPVSGTPPPKIRWLRNGEALKPGPDMKMTSNNRLLEIVRAHVTDTARYTCIASNEAGELRRSFDLEVLVPASIAGEGTTELIEVVENHTVYFVCAADGIPPPSILWLRNKVPLLDFPYSNMRELSNGRQLEMRNVQVLDEGMFQCQATNVAGQKSKNFQLKVLVPPKIPGSRSETEISVVTRRPVKMECEPSGVPEPTITWMKDGVPIDIEQTTFLRLLRNGRVLQIAAANVDDSGLYTCAAQNTAGHEQRRYRLQVHVPPNVNNSHVIEELSVVIGSPVAMHCPAYGSPEPTIRWLREGMPITFLDHPNVRVQDGGHTLQVHNMQLLDVGGYTCVATNVAGNTTKDFLLNILVPPTLEDGVTEVAATVDSRATLPCDTLGLPKPEVVWEKDGAKIAPAGSRYMMSRTGSLQFTNIHVNDSGMYRCIATNDAGSVHRDITLTVQVPPKIEGGPLHLKAIVGSKILLPCRTTGIPAPRIVWQKGTRILNDVLDNGSLNIESVVNQDAGTYVCIAQNNAGTAMSQVKLEVQVPPSIEKSVSEFRVVQDRDITLPCRVSGIPSPRVRWEKDGRPITDEDLRYRKLRSGWLALAVVRTEDAGRYTCIAENDAGRASNNVQVIVNVPPDIEDGDRVLTVNQTDRVELPCIAMGFPKPTISWIKDGRQIIESGGKYRVNENGSLIITDVQKADKGSYVCTAKNSAGRDSKEVNLRVQVPPSFIQSPRDLEVTANGKIELECIAEGEPTPVIKWKINNTDFHVTASMNGRSRLIISDARKHDDGTYMCIAENPAGQRRIVAGVRVKVPPKVLLQSGNQAVSISERVLLDCPVDGADPPPVILWTKNDQPVEISGRIQQLHNGSLVIYDSSNDDAGEYKCVATNEAGSSEGIAYVTVKVPPEFKIEPRSMTVDRGATVQFDCVAEGEPAPQMSWRKGRVTLPNKDERFIILPNNTLRIVMTQLSDAGHYICIARNSLESILVSAELTVQVHGRYSSWSRWSECSATCGEGTSLRTRTCDNPEPANGGRACSGPAKETKSCYVQHCSVDGGWSVWSDWEPCSQSCGTGYKSRTRDCTNPVPQNGGRMCDGDHVETIQCNSRPCPVDGGWSSWSPWRPCSESCGEGIQERYRKCDSPYPEHGGRECVGSDTDRQPCHATSGCHTNGNWGSWSAWSTCTLSCGGGTRSRRRNCDSPAPSNGGRFCAGSDMQIDYCNRDDCPVHGGWAEWSSWGDCTVTCGGGQRRRFRTCSNPVPRHNGRPCIGFDQETETCNSQNCAVDGEWGAWSDWSDCSKLCGTGIQQRHRLCRHPLFGGIGCLGDNSQVKKCNLNPCKGTLPHRALANVIGNVNNVEFGIAKIYGNITRTATGTEVSGTVEEIPELIAYNLQPLIPILTPIYWTTAVEIGEAVNGYTLTQGNFQREVDVEFTTGEILKMTHISRGVDADGILTIDIVLSGEVPVLPEYAEISILPYTENYIQTGADSLYGHSSRVFQLNGHLVPYAWNHTIKYERTYGHMPYLVERLTTSDIDVRFDFDAKLIRYRTTATIAKGEPSNQCPTGFQLDSEGTFCKDDDECSRNTMPCSHNCVNTFGSFLCQCPNGFLLDPTGLSCQDVDECATGLSNCRLGSEDCINTPGSFRCLSKCPDGYRRSKTTQQCDDVDECREQPNLCDHECRNLPGSYQCSCQNGYALIGRTKCQDIDECNTRSHRCSHQCVNTRGGYTCTCPSGYIQSDEFTCQDIDECSDGSYRCRDNQQCRNIPGGYQCVESCPAGFTKSEDGTCVDVDECRVSNECQFNQICVNNIGGYSCTCPRGYRSNGPNSPCVDIDECASTPSPCSHSCQNTRGGYHCLCPPGQKLLADRKSCAGLQYVEPNTRQQQLTFAREPARSRCPLKGVGRSCFTNTNTSSDVMALSSSSSSSSSHTNIQPCPRGYARKNGQCVDIDECQKLVRCQHGCQNSPGSYQCTCPPGYRLAANRRTCQDIDECAESKVTCPENQKCFNKRGDYECVDISCPAQYDRDPVTGYCMLDCQKPGVSCPPGAPRYKQILEFHMVALPSGILARQDLIRLVAYDQENVHLPRTTFTILENDDRVPFAIRLEEGKGVVYTLRALQDRQMYKIKVEAKSFDHRRRGVQYETTFMIYISVSSFPY